MFVTDYKKLYVLNSQEEVDKRNEWESFISGEQSFKCKIGDTCYSKEIKDVEEV